MTDAWSVRSEPLPISWIVEESARRCKALALKPPSRQCVENRLRDRGLESLQKRMVIPTSALETRPPRSNRPLAIVQMDHTLVDIMVVDEIHRQSMGRPWVTVAFDIATYCRSLTGMATTLSPTCQRIARQIGDGAQCGAHRQQGGSSGMYGMPPSQFLKATAHLRNHRLAVRQVRLFRIEDVHKTAQLQIY